jgi:hypothetical protein
MLVIKDNKSLLMPSKMVKYPAGALCFHPTAKAGLSLIKQTELKAY